MQNGKINIKTFSDPGIIDAYNRFLATQQYTSFFHSVGYYNALVKTPGVEPVLLLHTDGKQVLASAIGERANEVAYLPYLTRRLIFNSPPLYQNLSHLEILLNKLKVLKAGLFIQIRPFFPVSYEERSLYSQMGFEFTDHLNAFVSFCGHNEESLFLSFSKDKRKGIRKAREKYGLSIIEFDDIEYAVSSFYRILRRLFKRKRHPIKSQSYFYNLIKESKKTARIAFAIYNGEPIATQLYLINGKTITALYTATLEEHLEKYAGDLLIWFLMQKGLDEGFEIFDFGGAGNPNKAYSPRDYKKRFGSIFQNVGRINLPKSILYKGAIHLYDKMKKS